MDQESYEYTGMMADAWDLLRGDTSIWSDRFFYRDLIGQYGQPVLDVGCGTGRLLLDYLAQGIDIDGVDNSPEMLAICVEKAQRLDLHPRVFEQAMERLDLHRADRPGRMGAYGRGRQARRWQHHPPLDAFHFGSCSATGEHRRSLRVVAG